MEDSSHSTTRIFAGHLQSFPLPGRMRTPGELFARPLQREVPRRLSKL